MKYWNVTPLRNAGKYRQWFWIIAIMVLFSANKVHAQGPCDQISFSKEDFGPCEFGMSYTTQTDCYIELRFILTSGEFASYTVNSADGFIVQEISPSELWVTHEFGFIPTGFHIPLFFTLPYDLNTSMSVAFDNSCAQLGCEIIGGWPIQSCPDPQDASIIGVKYRECGSLPYTNQTTIPGWPIQLLDADGNIIEEQLTGADGSYAFYDRPKGIYIIKEVQQPGWTSSVPANGQYTVNLAPSQQVERNFGNCPGCSCDSIYMDVVQLPFTNDTCTYTLSSTNSGAYCFNSFNISISSGSFASVTPATGWTAVQLDSQHVQLDPPGDYLANGYCPNWVIWTIAGSDDHQITVSTSWNNGGVPVSCSRAFSFQCPPPSSPPPCCPAGSSFGNELVTNGDFELGNQFFSNSYTYFNPGGPTMIGKYSVLNQSQVFSANNQWACSDHTAFSPTGKMLVIDGFGGNLAWEQTISVVAGTNYAFSAWVNNLLIPTKNSGDPQMALFVGNTQITSTLILPETPDQWVRLCGTWIAPATTSVTLSIRMLSTAANGNDVAIDDVSVRACIPPPICETSIKIIPLNDCGLVQVMAVTNGPGPISYQWCDGQINQTYNTQLTPCVPVTFCVDATCANGNTATATQSYTFSDQIPPIAVCNPGVGVTLDPSCTYQLTPAFINGGSSDNCHIQSMSVFPDHVDGCGTFPVTLTVIDDCGNISRCTTGIQTTDTVPPTITCPQNITVQGQFVTQTLCAGYAEVARPVIMDNCSGKISLVNDYTGDGIASSGYPSGSTVVTWTAKDECGNTTTCSMSVLVEGCDTLPKNDCCAYSLYLYNGDINQNIKKVRISGLCETEICCADPDFWAITENYPYYIELYPEDGSVFPSGPDPLDVIDNDFLIWLKNNSGPNNIQVDWFDNSGIICTHTIEVDCNTGHENEDDYNWSQYTSNSKCNNSKLDIFLVRDSAEDEETACDPSERDISEDCAFQSKIECCAPYYCVTLTPPSNYSDPNKFTCKWNVAPQDPNLSTPQVQSSSNIGSFKVSNDGSDAGTYEVTLVVFPNGKTDPACITSQDIVINQTPVPSFEYKDLPCSNAGEFTFTDIAHSNNAIKEITWSCTTLQNFPTGGPIQGTSPFQFTFPDKNPYTIKMIIKDQYGCLHETTKVIDNTTDCNPDFDIKYMFCEDECASGNAIPNKQITINNNSKGGDCNQIYMLNINGGGFMPFNSSYNLPNASCTPGAYSTLKVELKMSDDDGNGGGSCPNGKTISQEFTIAPCGATITKKICPDGKVWFKSDKPGKWDLLGYGSITPDTDKPDKDGVYHNPIQVNYLFSGGKSIKFTAMCDGGAYCELPIMDFEVIVGECFKKDGNRDNWKFDEDGKKWKMKGRLKYRPWVVYHNDLINVKSIKSITRLRKRVKAGFYYYKPTKEGTLSTKFDGNVYKREDGEMACDCAIVEQVSSSNGPFSGVKRVATIWEKLGTARIRKNSIKSEHKAKITNTGGPQPNGEVQNLLIKN